MVGNIGSQIGGVVNAADEFSRSPERQRRLF